MNKNEIIKIIKIGLRKGYTQNLLLLSSYNEFIDKVREYLLTVNLAQQLLKWNSNHTYKIRIEYPVLYFYNNAFLDYDWQGDFFDISIKRRSNNLSPTKKLNQQIDLVITEEQNGANGSVVERTKIGIELKGINKNNTDIINDAERMAKAMILTDSISSNSIEYCFCAFLKRLDTNDEVVSKVKITLKIEEETKNWETICSTLKNKFPNLNFSIEFFDIVNTSYETIEKIHQQMESDYSEVAMATGVIVGGILSIQNSL